MIAAALGSVGRDRRAPAGRRGRRRCHRAALERGLDADVLVSQEASRWGRTTSFAGPRPTSRREVWGVAVKPLLAFGVRGETLVFGLPGNPVSSSSAPSSSSGRPARAAGARSGATTCQGVWLPNSGATRSATVRPRGACDAGRRGARGNRRPGVHMIVGCRRTSFPSRGTGGWPGPGSFILVWARRNATAVPPPAARREGSPTAALQPSQAANRPAA
jgi:hypothetical protein